MKRTAYQLLWQKRNRHKIKQYRQNQRRVARDFLNWCKAQPCQDCGNSYPPYVMDFDHRPGTEKKFSLGMDAYNMSHKQIVEEVLKCDVVCANCHRVRTHGRQQT
ncbi:MAG: hypothetical protein MN733_07345 [Nitrososphaera sp.]|nr:hypothetical protein [Nitrososphaera sp.]